MRQTIFLYDDWRFHVGFDDMGFYKGYDDSSWQKVSVPHDASVMFAFDKSNSSGTGYLPGGQFFYRRRFNLPKERGKVYITFEGVYNNSKVWVNSSYMGKRPYGYSTFTYDITDIASDDNVVSVLVERTQTADSRWYTGCGITRRVYLTVCDAVSIVPDSLFVTTPSVSKDEATIHVELETTTPAQIHHSVLDREKVIAEGDGDLCVKNPSLWSPDNPHLYTLKTEVSAEGEIKDTVYTTFGIRYFSFDADKGFFLNGEPMKLKGVCVHHDAGTLGAAVPKAIWRDRLLKLKECGANALRTSHNPPDPTLLELCDELGFLTMDEAFDEWEGPKNKWWQGHNVYPPKRFGYYEDFPEWGEKDIKTMVLRDRNHPSIIMWSIGNEIDYPNDPYCHPSLDEATGNNDHNKPQAERMYDPNKPNAERLAVIARKLVGYVKECDTTRPVTAALAFPEISTLTGYFQALDIVGYNYKEHLYENDHKRFPNAVIYGSENSHSYEAWKAVVDNDYIAGQFLWTGIDYMGEAHGWPVRASMPGLLDMAGFPKESWHFRKTLWCDEPHVYLAARVKPQHTEERRGRKPPMRFGEHWNFEDGAEVEVLCITNSPTAELFLNGKSVGVKSTQDGRHQNTAMWELTYEKGALTVSVGKAERTLVTTDEPYAIRLDASRKSMTADCYDTIRVDVSVVDKDGKVVQNADNTIYAQITGAAEISGIENGSGHDLTPYSERFRKLNGGRLVIYIKSTAQKGEAKLTVTSDGLESALIAIKAE
ncbi:MAG: DUF4982 domain-containing protein [Clostridia bacterium]|nr:DUF4982 domain-containing protein [Clostridia bacterium]